MHSAIYHGTLRHRRFLPKRHEFSYSSSLFYMDLDELPSLFSGVKGWSYNAKNFGAFHRSDYLGDPSIPLKDAVRTEVARIAGHCPMGAVRMLTNLRIFGFCFNPVTLYYIFDVDADNPSLILTQVNNTPWDERHSYVIHCDPQTGAAKTAFDKAFHVSPFNPLDMHYHWISTNPDEHLVVHMENHKKNEFFGSTFCHMDATLTLRRKPWSHTTLQKIVWQQPWLAIKVPFAIYWQATKLFIKGVPLYSHKKIDGLTDKPASIRLNTTGDKP